MQTMGRIKFVGRALPLTDHGIHKAAKIAGTNYPEIMAIIEVETNGHGYLADKRPVILFERHIFSRLTCGRYDKTHRSISDPECGGYGASGAYQYERLSLAMSLDQRAALHSCSFGLGQIMGFNHNRAGYTSVENMIGDFCDSEDAQLIAVAAFIRKSGLSEDLASHNWMEFAYRYNGPSFDRHDYDGRLAKAYEKWAHRGPMNCIIRAIQIEMKYAGFYNGKIDGIDGPLTQAARTACDSAGIMIPPHGEAKT